jgi:hypothetical protein
VKKSPEHLPPGTAKSTDKLTTVLRAGKCDFTGTANVTAQQGLTAQLKEAVSTVAMENVMT